MKNFKHSKGPWKNYMGNYGTYASINQSPLKRICTLQLSKGSAPIEEAGANAQLIATAPELLEALNDLVEAKEKRMGSKAMNLRFEIAKDIINKATNIATF